MSLNVLFLTAQIPYPPRLGGALRSHGMLNGLAGRHQVSLLSLRGLDQPDPLSTPLAQLCQTIVSVPAPQRTTRRRVANLLAGRADLAQRLWSDDYAARLTSLLAKQSFDVLHVGGIEMAPYLHTIREAGFAGKVIFDNYNAEAALQKRIFQIDLRTPTRWHAALYSFIQWRRLVKFETVACALADHVLAVSGLDKQLLSQLKHSTPITVIPNAIHVSDYTLTSETAHLPQPALVFTGKMDYRPNVDAALWFADHILPVVRQHIPAAHFAIVGQQPHTRLDTLRNRPDVTLTGAVDSIQPYIAAAAVYVVPMRMGSGTRFKVLEAMAMQRAIVSTTLGAQGLDAQSGQHFLLADTPDAFAHAVIELLQDDTRRAELGRQAHAFVSHSYDWGHIVPRLEAVYASS